MARTAGRFLYTGLQISSANAQDADLRRPATAFNAGGAEPTNGPAQGNSPEEDRPDAFRACHRLQHSLDLLTIKNSSASREP